MIRKGFVAIAGAIVAAVVFSQAHTSAQVPAKTPTQQPMTAAAEAPTVSASTLMSVRIPKRVMADGQALTPGNYSVRVTSETGSPVVGQTPAQQHWVEFLQGSAVKGRALATVLPPSEAKTIAKQGLPANGAAKVETLVGNEYLRVWINKGGTNYLIHLSVPTT
jgi:hypothetical protein